MIYDRQAAVEYAHKWAFSRNPEFYIFDELGGDCTNFCSQCLYAGYPEMNYTKDTGWYYISPSSRAAAWTGVSYLHRFLTTNRGPGPAGIELPLENTVPGDIVQLSFDGEVFSHSLFVVSTGRRPSVYNILIATHSKDSDNRPLSTYTYSKSRLIHIFDQKPG